MAYFMINNVDFSAYVCSLKISKAANYNSQTNAAGNTVVDYINSKRSIEVGIIPLNSSVMEQLLSSINSFNVSVSYRNPDTNALVNGVNCIIPKNDVEYYTIQSNNVSYKAMNLKFTEL